MTRAKFGYKIKMWYDIKSTSWPLILNIDKIINAYEKEVLYVYFQNAIRRQLVIKPT